MSKRILSMLAVVVLIAAMFAFTAASADGYYAVYSHCKNGKPLNVRSGPGKDFPVIDKVPYGQPIYVIGETVSGWLQLNDTGYVQASLTCRNYPGPYVPPDPSKEKSTSGTSDVYQLYQSARYVNPYTVTLKATQKSNGVANVRWAPSKASPLQYAYPAGTQVRVIAELGNNWYQVQEPVSEKVGFVNTAYVQ